MDILSEIQKLSPFFHNFILHGIRTKPITGNSWNDNYPQNLWEIISPYVDITKGKVLDIGCNAGFFSFKFAEMGADVLGIDREQPEATTFSFQRAIEQANFIKSVLGLEATFIKGNFFDVKGMFDVVLFLGVYYHLKDYALSLPKINSLLNKDGVLYLESAVGRECEHYGENKVYHNDRSNYFVPTVEYLKNDLINNGFIIEAIKEYNNDRVFIKSRKV